MTEETKREFTQEELDFILEGREPLEQLKRLMAQYEELSPRRNIGGIRTRAELLLIWQKMKDIVNML